MRTRFHSRVLPAPARKRRGARGYTAIELLMAITLFAIGGAGVIAMQKVTIQGGEDARRFDMATNIANEWLGRLQRDASFWTRPNSQFPDQIDIANTKWLNSGVNGCAAFCNPPAPVGAVDGVSPAFDSFGRDLPATGGAAPGAFYCVQYRMNWLVQPSAGASPWAPPLNTTSLIRAEVRVLWNRLEANPIGNCAALVVPDALPVPPLVSPFHSVYATTSIRQQARR